MNQELIEAAKRARASAYAPHSGFSVGAAVLGSDGKCYTGCNVENDSYGLTMCAERNAIAEMVKSGCRIATEIAIATENGATPCGACRQVMHQFRPLEGEMNIYLVDSSDTVRQTKLSTLFPDGFSV